MEFKDSKVTFGGKGKFSDDMKRFVIDEAARFTSESNEAASASIDETAEHIVRFSKQKSLGRIKEHKKALSELKERRNEIISKDDNHINPSKEENSSGSRSSSDKARDSKSSESEIKAIEKKESTIKKEKSKEAKKAASKTAVANMFKAKKELSNALASDKSTGDALRDGNSGLLRVLTDYINPMRYLKKLMAKLVAVIAPYILSFMAVATVLIVILTFIFSILQPIAEVGEALTNFLSIFSVETDTFRNTSFSSEELEEIVANAGADETQEKVIRYALSKVGYPYSQAKRTSGTAYDCSSLAYYAWNDAGVDISYGSGYPPTAAEGARVLESKGKNISTMDLKPGDLIYYGGASNGRYLGIYHVAIYVGNGKAVEALNEKYGVVYQTLRTKNAIMVCRPNK